jgi:hypothetical protein
MREPTFKEGVYNAAVNTLLSNIFRTSLSPEFTLANEWNMPTRER